MRLSLLIGSIALGMAAAPAMAAAPPDPATALITQAAVLIGDKRPIDAQPLLDEAIADEVRAHAAETRRIYCARSLAETLLYMAMAAQKKQSAVALGPEWSEALFLKGFALVDSGAGDQAKPLFEQAIALSPMNAHYLAELGEWYKVRRDWDRAYDLFSKAADAADFSPDTLKSAERRRGWRGMGFVRTEQKRYDEAEALYRKCLDLDPTDTAARGELDYIAKQRAGGAGSGGPSPYSLR